ncbi:hypothetical protein [Flavobacterium sp.]|uniref:hypothetical protein n=1 Tax=Flavobacterium sp. TaxID=239 RepID=UPI002601EB76|nr:hypothetical protein [Flavobacterium sp.]MDG2433540.1 hypothetical protein [Flavobacterium sp.]
MNITAEKSFLIDLLQNSTDIEFLNKVKRFILKEVEANAPSNKESDVFQMDLSTDINNIEKESPLEVQKMIEIWTDYTQYFRSAPKLDSK